ncbi:MAG: DUF559 domain-containing protein [Candidatus Aenigmarchaeota archaeon]|nr:DUF559 domain-containing protein [Candidatus Aenigmarchaeota archaeon]
MSKYFCNECRKPITEDEFLFSTGKYRRPLCRFHQKEEKKSTPEALELGKALKSRGVPVELEKFDGFKHIDIAVFDAKVNIEVDGVQHNLKKEQALADLKRTFFSFKKGFLTLRIPNILVRDKKTLEETADFITEFLIESRDQLE